MHRLLLVLLPLLLLAAMAGPGCAARPADRELLVSAASSLKDVMTAVKPLFEAAHPGLKLRFNYGGSGSLRMQLENGAPAALFIAASVDELDPLERKGLLVPGTRRVVAGNTLVLVRRRAEGPPFSRLEDLAGTKISRVAIGSPATVPAGRYAREVLEKRGLYGRLQDKLIFAENVRQALDYVARGEVDAGFVFNSDAMAEAGCAIVETIPAGEHQPIHYPAAVLKTAPDAAAAAAFMAFLRSQDGARAFRRAGFSTPAPR